MTLDQIVERTRLPIRVRCRPCYPEGGEYEWEIEAPLETFPWLYLVEQYDVKSATAQYLHCVAEISEIYRPGSMR